MQVLTDDGARIAACVDGRERTRAVLLVHGFPFAHAIWDAQNNALAAIARVIRLDLRGAGMSSVPEGPYLMERLAADIAVLLDALGIERAALVGHSMGGYVALAFSRMFTERVERLALVSSRLAADASCNRHTVLRKPRACRRRIRSSVCSTQETTGAGFTQSKLSTFHIMRV